jgi:TRAP-type C4-dicarboxylate transport system permease small subunit
MAWNGWVLAESVMAYKIPTLGLPEGINHLPLAISGILIALFSLEHIVARWRGEDVIPSWH